MLYDQYHVPIPYCIRVEDGRLLIHVKEAYQEPRDTARLEIFITPGITPVDHHEAPTPAPLTADTLKLYVTPLVSQLTVIGLPDQVAVMFPVDDVTT